MEKVGGGEKLLDQRKPYVWYNRNSKERIREEKSKKEIAHLSRLVAREIGKRIKFSGTHPFMQSSVIKLRPVIYSVGVLSQWVSDQTGESMVEPYEPVYI